MLGATLQLMGAFSIKMEYHNSLTLTAYVFVFMASTYLIYKQKMAAQWIVLSTIGIGFLLNFLNTYWPF